MAARVQKPSEKPIEEMMKSLKLDHCAKINDSDTVTAKNSSAGEVSTGGKEGDIDHDSIEIYRGLPSPFGGYYGYYYPGYDGSLGGLDDQGYPLVGDGTDYYYPVMQAENGSLVYMMPGVQPCYSPSNTYLPVNAVGFNQYAGQQLHSPSQVFASPGYASESFCYGELVSPYMWDPGLVFGDFVYANVFGGASEFTGKKNQIPSASHMLTPSAKKETSFRGNGRGDQLKPSSQAYQHPSTFQPGVLGKGYIPFTRIPAGSSNGRKDNQEWLVAGKLKSRNKNGVSDFSRYEQNHGPKPASSQEPLTGGGNAIGSMAADGMFGKNYSINSVIKKDEYNLADFSTTYEHAFFFVIKSYSEDDVHKSIKYKVWASTPHGNGRLDSAYQEAQKRASETGKECPVFLFFSVNASGQFCGVAEMTGRVDFDKTMDFWQQDKWNGYFPVKWHIIKDVPNPQLRHIILENNENKPVTNSRDTQEVRLPQGTEMLKVFKNYTSKTSILDDFDFYESREKVLLEKKLRSSMAYPGRIKKSENPTIGLQPTHKLSGNSHEQKYDEVKAENIT